MQDQPIFAVRKAMVYVLPDSKSAEEVFGSSQAASTGFDASSAVPAQVQGGNGVFSDSSASRKR